MENVKTTASIPFPEIRLDDFNDIDLNLHHARNLIALFERALDAPPEGKRDGLALCEMAYAVTVTTDTLLSSAQKACADLHHLLVELRNDCSTAGKFQGEPLKSIRARAESHATEA